MIKQPEAEIDITESVELEINKRRGIFNGMAEVERVVKLPEFYEKQSFTLPLREFAYLPRLADQSCDEYIFGIDSMDELCI